MDPRFLSRSASLGLALGVCATLWSPACASSPEGRGAGAGGGSDAGLGGAPSVGGGTTVATSATSTGAGGGGAGVSSTTQIGADAGPGVGGGSAGEGGATGCAPPAPVEAPSGPPVCGDGFRDPGTEECDDGAGNGLGACAVECTVTEPALSAPPADAGGPSPGTTLGGQPHPVAIGAWGFAAGVSAAPAELDVSFFDNLGRLVVTRPVSAGSTLPPSGTGVALAALDCGRYAAAWTDYGDDGDGAGVALRRIDSSVPLTGPPGHANAGTDFDQVLEDMIWTGSGSSVAWSDDGDLSSGGDLKIRTFDGSLSPTSADQMLAHTSGLSTSAVLAPFAGSWAAAWLSYEGGAVSVLAQAGAVSWSAGKLGAGATVDRPALVDLDATHLLLVYAASVSATEPATLQGAILDTAVPGSTLPFAIPFTGAPSGSSAREPSAARVGSSVFLSWVSTAEPSSAPALDGDVWLKQIDVGATPGSLDLSQAEIPLPRLSADATGAQAAPALASVLPGNPAAVLAVWQDHGVPGSPRVAVEAIPVPILRKVGQ